MIQKVGIWIKGPNKNPPKLISPLPPRLSWDQRRWWYAPLPLWPWFVTEPYSSGCFLNAFANTSFPGFWRALCCQSYWLKPLVDFKTSSPCIVTDLLKMDFSLCRTCVFQLVEQMQSRWYWDFQIEAVSSYCRDKRWHYHFFCFSCLFTFLLI